MSAGVDSARAISLRTWRWNSAGLSNVWPGRNRRTPERAATSAIHENSLDFGKLDESFQKLVIERLASSPMARQDVRPSVLCPPDPDPDQVRQNRQAVIDHFNLEMYGERLMQLYRTVADLKPAALDDLNADVLLDQFLAPERFCLLRT